MKYYMSFKEIDAKEGLSGADEIKRRLP